MTKQELRQILRDRRKGVTEEQQRATDRAIAEAIARSELFQNASTLLLYAPMKGEINLLPLARMAQNQGKAIAFPRCDTEANTMAFYVLPEGMRLIPGAYGIPEPPADAPLCVPDEQTLCILPGLSFDLAGNRLGYGKGYYDRYVSNFPGVTLGAISASMLLRSVPTEAHDVPVQWICTEHGMRRAALQEPMEEHATDQLTEEEKKPTENQATQAPQARLKSFLTACQKLLQGKGEVKPLHLPPLLALCTYVLLLLSRLVDGLLLDRGNEAVGVILLQVLIFIIPAILYCKLRGERFSERIRLRPFRPEHSFFLIHLLVVMITLSLLSSILTGGIRSLVGNFTLYSTFVARTDNPADVVYAILAYALLPALGEELVFRSILCAEYEKHGVGVAITVSALFFAMLHFSFSHFLTYLLLGALLACAMYTTRSFLAPVLLHLAYNVFCLFGQPYLSAFYVNAGSTELFLFSLVALFLLFSAFAVGEARKIYHLHAKRNADSSYTATLPWRRLPATVAATLTTPTAAACLILFLITSIVMLF